MTQGWIVPPQGAPWSLFLDVDGTLLDIAERPGDVVVPRTLVSLLARLREQLDGRLALVSGRTLAVLDVLFAPLRLPAAGIHGLERRDAAGALHYIGLPPDHLDPARMLLRALGERHDGLLVEDKGVALAVHYRLVPSLEPLVLDTVQAALAQLPRGVHVQHGHCVIELKSAAGDKGRAIGEFMREPPFAGGTPVFLGDDVTDEDGFAWVAAAGGYAVKIGPAPEAGRGWLPGPAAVREWLGSLAGGGQAGTEEGRP